MLHYLTPIQMREMKYLIVNRIDVNYQPTPETKRERGMIKLKIQREAFRYRILEKPEHVQKCIIAIQTYIKRKLPLYAKRLR